MSTDPKFFWLDFETFLIQPGCAAPPPVCMVYAYDDGVPELAHVTEPGFRSVLKGALESDTIIVAHNAAFEVLVMMAYEPTWTPLIFEKLRRGGIRCTMIREKLVRIGQGDKSDEFALDACLEARGIPIKLDKQSPWRVRYGTLIDKPIGQWPQEAIDYVMGDMAVRDLYAAQEADGAEYLVDQHPQMRAAVSLALTSAWGLATDPVAAAALVKSTEELLEADKEILLTHGLARRQKKAGVMVVTKDKKAAEGLLVSAYQKAKRPVPRGDITPLMAAKGITQGNVQLDEEACTNSGDPILKSYTRFSQAGTLLGKARRLLHSPIQCRYNVLVATGRTSCSQGKDPQPGEPWTAYGMQIQNLPRVPGIRECFVARPGHALVSIDFDQFELRTWSQVCIELLGFSDMAAVLRDPSRCPHVEMGAMILGISAAEMYALKKIDLKLFKEMRQLAKCPNFGGPGGLGAARFGDFARGTYGVDVSEERAKELLQLWRDQWREAGRYLDHISQLVGRRGNRVQISHTYSKRLRGNVGYCDAANSFFQGRAADAAKAGLVELMFAMYERGYDDKVFGVRQVAFIHDEVVLEIPLERLHEAAYAARDRFVAGAQVVVPDVPLTASPAAMLRLSKSAGDPVHNAQGELICYEERERS